MKKIMMLCLSGLLLVGFYSCNSDSSKIKDTVKSFFKALNVKDFNGAKKYATKESQDFLQMIEAQAQQVNDTSKMKQELFMVDNVKIDGTTATASVRSETQPNPITVHLKKEGADWKVAFDKNTIMTMVNDEMSKSPQTKDDINDQVNKALDSVRQSANGILSRPDTQTLVVPQ